MEQFDVVIVGAGISGIGSAYHLRTQCPEKSFVILEAMETAGGTWVTHRYPGVRSDSDMFTYGYRFKPWVGQPIASGEEILGYIHQVIKENDLAPHIRYRHQIISADWSSATHVWIIEAVRIDSGETIRFRARFLWMCQGYYRHSQGYTPRWKGIENCKCPIVHPQHWPVDLDCSNKNVVVIGSGATAATLVPQLARICRHVTMLQRSPTYYLPRPTTSELANTLRALEIPPEWTHEIVRRKNLAESTSFIRRTLTEPEQVRQELLGGVQKFLGEKYDISKHFTPSYRPWQQRIALIPDGDFLIAVRSGSVTIVTDEIDRLDETGIVLQSGGHLHAEIIVTATGFDLSLFGDIQISMDGDPVDFGKTVGYRGMMFTGVPNFVWVFGYIRSSWTLRVDLLADFVCRLLKTMDQLGVKCVTPKLRPQDREMQPRPWIIPDNFNPGYLQRSLDILPKQGDRSPWENHQDYQREKRELPEADLHDGLEYV